MRQSTAARGHRLMRARRYRSQLCNDGPKCRRKVCFFAHTIDELRVPPSKPFVAPDMLAGAIEPESAAAGPQAQVTSPIFSLMPSLYSAGEVQCKSALFPAPGIVAEHLAHSCNGLLGFSMKSAE